MYSLHDILLLTIPPINLPVEHYLITSLDMTRLDKIVRLTIMSRTDKYYFLWTRD